MPFLKKRASGRMTKTMKAIPRLVREEPVKAAAAGIVAAAAGVLAVRKIRNSDGDDALHVRASDGSGWVLTRGNSTEPLERFERKRQAVEAGRELAKSRAGTLLIHRSNGTIARRHVFQAN